MSCVLHFGMHKTGSGSIQRSLYHSLRDPRFCYLDLGQANASRALTTAFSATPERQAMSRKHGLSHDELQRDVQRYRKRLDAQLRRAKGSTAILSAEHVVFLKPPELADMLQFIERHRPLSRAVGYVRAPASFMGSVFQQRVKGGREGNDIAGAFPRYRQRFEKLEALLGRQRMDYWRFEPGDFPGGCVVRDFCTRLGIDFDPAGVVHHNEGLSLPALRLLYAYRLFGPGYGVGKHAGRENFALGHVLAGLPGPKLRFHAEVVAPLLEAHRDEIAWMEERLDKTLTEPLHEDAGAVSSMDELLRFGEEELAWLAALTGGQPVPPDPAAVATRMHKLRLEALKLRHPPRAGIFKHAARRILNAPRGGATSA